jgi:hypothetical protein
MGGRTEYGGVGMFTELVCEGPLPLRQTGICPECEGPVFLGIRKGASRNTKGVASPKGRFTSILLAAEACGVSESTAKGYVRRGSFGWRYTGETHASQKVSTVEKKYCSVKCRESWHSRNKDYEPRNERVAFALRLLKFMEKQFPEQTRKMREGFKRKEE